MADYTGTMSAESSEALSLLSDKRTLLNSPGYKMSNLYYSTANSAVDMIEITYNMGRFEAALSTPRFGAQSQVILNNSSFVGEVYLSLRLPNIYPGQTLSRGWGYIVIQQMSFLFGSSNVSQLQINGQSLWHKIAMSCETAEKRSEFWRLGGAEQLTPVMRINVTTGLPERDDTFYNYATIILPLPWSSASSAFHKKAFDTNLLNNPITIQIQLNTASAIYGGSVTPYPFPEGFDRASMLFRQGTLYSQNMSLKNTLSNNPELSTFYPWIYTQSYLPTQFQGSNDPANPITIPLLGFIKADLLSITIGVVRVSQLAPSGLNPPNAFQYDNIRNIDMSFNGTRMFYAPGDSWKAFTIKSEGAQYFHNSIVSTTTTPGVYTSSPQDAYLLQIDFSAERCLTVGDGGLTQNTWRIGNNVLSISLNTEGDSTVRYQMFCSYHYNSTVQIQQGQSSIYFD